MALYTFSIDNVALVASTAKTVIELGTTANTRAKIIEWWVEAIGTKVNAEPIKIEVGRFSAAVTTATTGTASQDEPSDPPPDTVVKHSTTVEGAGSAESGIEIRRLHPQSRTTAARFSQALIGREYVLTVSTFWRIRVTAGEAVNVTVGVRWEEDK